MGGLIAQAAALRARPRIQSLTLMCTFADGREGSRMSPAMMLRATRTRLGTRMMRRRAMMDLIMPPGFHGGQPGISERLGAIFGRDLADPAPIAMQQLKAMSRYDATAGLGALAGVPTLVVSAAHDLIARAPLGRALASAIRGRVMSNTPTPPTRYRFNARMKSTTCC